MIKLDKYEKEIRPGYADILSTLGKILDPNIRGEISLGKRSIQLNTYEDQPIPDSDLTKKGEEYDQLIQHQVERELRSGKLTLTMFTCPNGNATDIRNDSASVIPPKFNLDQILVQRFPLLFTLIKKADIQKIPLNLILIIGDTDFLADYDPLIKSNNTAIDLEGYIQNVTAYRDSLINTFRERLFKKGLYIDVYGYKDQDISNLYLEQTSIQRPTVSVISLMLNTSIWGTDTINPLDIDQRDIIEEAFYTSRRCNSPRFDPTIFAGRTPAVYQQIAEIKANEYRKQGEMVKKLGGKIILMDELPPALKTRFLTNKKDLLFIFPWIRDEDRWRNQDPKELKIVTEVKKAIKG